MTDKKQKEYPSWANTKVVAVRVPTPAVKKVKDAVREAVEQIKSDNPELFEANNQDSSDSQQAA